MKITRFPGTALVLAMFSTLNSELSTALAQGSLTPPGPPGPTMKTLAQIEARTPISSAPFLIISSGSYYLTTNVSVSTGNAITIGANGVTLDLNGFTISSTAASPTGDGIQLSPNVRDVTIVNGHIRSGVVDSGGVYTGTGFAFGIAYLLNPPANVLVSHVTVSGCLDNGIYLNTGDSTVVESCTVRTVGSEGIYAATIKESSATDCGGDAIYGDQVSDCQGQSTGTGIGVFAAVSAHNCYGNSSGSTGIVGGMTQNCYGNSTSSTGINASTALNCTGNTSGGGDGLETAGTAQNCYGSSNSGIGVSAQVAQNCACFSSTGIGLSAILANSCYAISSSGTAESITFKYNMP